MKVYLCGGISGMGDGDAKDWREAAKELFHSANIDTLDPMRRDYRGREGEPGVDSEIVRRDLVDIKNSAVVLVNASRPSWGTAMEAFFAATCGTSYAPSPKVVAFGAGDRPPPWLSYHCVLYPDLESACRAIIDYKKVAGK